MANSSSTALIRAADAPSPSLAARVINRSLAFFERLGLIDTDLSPDAMIASARRKTKLVDLGDETELEGLSVVSNSLKLDANLSPLGRGFMRGMLVDALATRLRLLELKKKRPEIFRAPLVPPLFILGLPRSGTTHLHRLLCCEENIRPVYAYEMAEPIPGKVDLRPILASVGSALLRRVVPELDAKHEVRSRQAEECFSLFNASFRSAAPWIFAPVYSYLEWYLQQELVPAFQTYRSILQVLQTTAPGARLTLKSPVYAGQLDALLEVFPDALVVQTHRDPLKVMPSSFSLFETFHRMSSESYDPIRLADTLLELFRTLANRNIASLERLPEDRIVHVQYREITRDPEGTVRRVYARLGLKFSQQMEQRVKGYIATHPQNLHGVHHYSLEAAGWTPERITTAFRPYLSRFPVLD